MQEGRVKWFNNERGYGFIHSLGKDYFVHHKNIVSKESFKTLIPDAIVTFDEVMGPKGICAANVRSK